MRIHRVALEADGSTGNGTRRRDEHVRIHPRFHRGAHEAVRGPTEASMVFTADNRTARPSGVSPVSAFLDTLPGYSGAFRGEGGAGAGGRRQGGVAVSPVA